jgi:tetratricopeptide (TPR) repeat protein
MTLAALENTEAAREQFEQSIALAPEQTESYFRLGLIELNVKDLDEAAANLHQVLTRDSKHAGALSGLGRVAFEQKHYYYLGLTFVRVGRKEEADSQLQISTRLEQEEARQRRVVLRIQDEKSDGLQNSEPKK